MMGRLSNQRMGWRHEKQREPGQMMLFSNGSRATSTFRNDPTIRPKRTTKTHQKMVVLLSQSSMP